MKMELIAVIPNIEIELKANAFTVKPELDIHIGAAYGIEDYEGPYMVSPDFTTQILETEKKRMLEDVNVNPIEVQRVSNPSGGVTVYIGGIING